MKRFIPSLIALLALILLAGCKLVTDVPLASPSAPTATPEPTPTVVEKRVLRIGLVAEPPDLLPYHSNPTDERLTAALTELLFPSPMLAVDFKLQSTGVLTRLPDFANGDVVTKTVTVFRDELGRITDTPTATTDEVTQVSVTFHWRSSATLGGWHAGHCSRLGLCLRTGTTH